MHMASGRHLGWGLRNGEASVPGVKELKGGWLDEVREQGADEDLIIAVSQRDDTKHQKDCGPLLWFIAGAAEPG